MIPGWFVLASQYLQYLYNQLMAWPRRRAQPPPLDFFSVKMSQDELQAIVLFDTVVA